MFTVVATVATALQQIVTEQNGTESEEATIMVITKIVLKWLLEFIGGKYDCACEDQHQLLNDGPVFSSEKVSHIDKTATD
jgi:hypothetical protein